MLHVLAGFMHPAAHLPVSFDTTIITVQRLAQV
jgi:hypothetical protein